jgi:dTMP kinase
MHFGLRGKFISFEGNEGSGKTTQAELLVKRLRETYPDKEILFTKEPGGTEVGQAIRDIICSEQLSAPLSPMSELLLILADRNQHLQQVIYPHLSEGHVVVCDRYIDSTIAYQVFGRGVSKDFTNRLFKEMNHTYMPHLTFWLDLDYRIALARIKGEGRYTRAKRRGFLFHQQVWLGYLQQANNNRDRISRIDGSGAIETIHNQIFYEAKALLDG